MKNFDKYQTMKERVKAFEAFCKTQQPWCLGCPYQAQSFGDICFHNWLNAEADEEKKDDEKQREI